ncbi:MAG: CRISPR system precrRNA processing endoribonuclease RAMP protein Cas6 [Rhodoferax sp.]|nr:CRISPR system precrRNA processing endoribonuclease RAMP protein Cas6 [Rhodoferax sp.]
MHSDIPLARYCFTARVQQPLALPDYAGSLLRGQFGAALRNVACMTRQPTCPGCPLLQTCPYTRIFEAPPPPKGQHALQDFSQIPNAYVLEPPTPGARVLDADDDFAFHLVLIGHATDQLALVIFALQRALAQGLTRERVPADLLQVDWVDALGTAHPVWTADQPILVEHTATLVVPAPERTAAQTPEFIANNSYSTGNDGRNDQHIALDIHTPLRLQNQGKPLGVGQLTPRALIAAIARRTALLMEFHAGGPPSFGGHSNWGEAAKHATALADTLTDTQDLHWFDWTRYSSRQHQAMTLGGVLGTWTLHSNTDTLTQLWPWLWLGQWLHVGKNATMGLGGYTLHLS